MSRKSLKHNISKQNPVSAQWIGRFAPSPTGSLHMGSLAAAVASYMIAKKQQGKWLIRIEDIDKQREVIGSVDSILTDLESYGLFWDDEVFYQSKNEQWHQHVIEDIAKSGWLYACDCSRKDILERSEGVYDAKCRVSSNKVITSTEINSHCPDAAIKINFSHGHDHFEDQILNEQSFTSAMQKQDFILKRRDGIFAYQLAVVADDIHQNINHVVRGADILDSTPKQNFLYDILEKTKPSYYHIPLITDDKNLKLSKSINSPSLKQVEYLQDQKKVITKSEVLLKIFEHLGQKIESSLHSLKPREIIEYYIDNWDTKLIINS
ncbi:MAG: tRNA glutamyl-Q(34) synthetase GluQRS [Kangiella sp.]|nr:MAG: tRNA glutamyl-Q(34) synthetase GluQRS [Kangiella sp.]